MFLRSGREGILAVRVKERNEITPHVHCQEIAMCEATLSEDQDLMAAEVIYTYMSLPRASPHHPLSLMIVAALACHCRQCFRALLYAANSVISPPVLRAGDFESVCNHHRVVGINCSSFEAHPRLVIWQDKDALEEEVREKRSLLKTLTLARLDEKKKHEQAAKVARMRGWPKKMDV